MQMGWYCQIFLLLEFEKYISDVVGGQLVAKDMHWQRFLLTFGL